MNAKVSKTSSPLQSTRQMLDELDALMERMLALPVGDNEELAPLPRDVRPSATVTASLTMQDDLADDRWRAAEEPPSSATSLHEEEQVSAVEGDVCRVGEESPSTLTTHHPSPATPSSESVAPSTKARESLAEAFEEQLPPPLAINRPVQYVTTPARPRVPRGSPLLAPLVWANQSFDRCTSWLGPLGRGLRSNRGRTLLGIVGLVCLGAAGAGPFWIAWVGHERGLTYDEYNRITRTGV